jgi:hypothetical protein
VIKTFRLPYLKNTVISTQRKERPTAFLDDMKGPDL